MINFVHGFFVWVLGWVFPLLVPLCFVLIVFIMWKMWRAMPNTKPMRIVPSSGSQVHWADVA
ncbi:MAG: hypothetical protein QOJ31_1342, partial [Gaiellales bacterium]|nr:hypothetical protein [Gaiellales bacterium]